MRAEDTTVDAGLASRQRVLIEAAGEQVARMRASSGARAFTSSSAYPVDAEALAGAFSGYEIVREVHRGAQGVVYQALQKSTRRQVAVKVMREGPFAGAADRARFEREVQILGRLDHPNVVTIHDSGIASGCHYFVMDYIDGAPLDEHLRKVEKSKSRKIETDELLGLFVKICEAVSAAHLKGVIHRDLKPGNIRIDRHGEPRILDFGLARLADDSSCLRHLTATGQFIGSLPWAAPEQARGDAHLTDVRTDVYALGVILYQILTGEFPYSVIGPVGDVLDRIARADPPPPSLAAQRRDSGRRIDDELDTIVLHCLAKEPERRYQSAGELARDIRRYLAGEAIEAKRDSVGYVLRKQLHRYRAAIAVCAGFMVVVIAGLFVSLGLWRSSERHRAAAEANLHRARDAESDASREAERARSEAVRAREQAQTAMRVRDFVTEVFKVADPEEGRGEAVTARELLDGGAAEAVQELQGEPQVQAAMLETLGAAYRGLGMYERSIELLERALPLRREGGRTLELAACLESLGDSLTSRHNAAAVEALMQEALDIRRSLQPPGHPDVGATLAMLAESIRLQTAFDRALPVFEEALAVLRAQAEAEPARLAHCLNNLGLLYKARAEYDSAESAMREAIALIRTAEGARSPVYAVMINNLALLLKGRGELEPAEDLLREGLEIRRTVYGDDHPKVAVALNNLGTLLHERQRLAEAEEVFGMCLEIRRRRLGPEHALIANTMANLASLLQETERYAEAEPLFREALEMRRKLQGPDHVETAKSLNNLGNLLQNCGDRTGAESLYREALAINAEKLGRDHPTTALNMSNLGTALSELERFSEAEPLFRQALDIQRRKLGDTHARVAGTLRNLADLLVRTGRPEEAEPLFREAIGIEGTALVDDHPLRAVTVGMLGACLSAQGRFAEAEPLVIDSFETILAERGADHATTEKALGRIIELYERWDRPDQIGAYQSLLPADPPLP